ncbi:MAG: hypothetical protein JWP14_456 [Frankiales bacterium]|nr:hypothetical protein [Frankiales bacterium]
MGASATLFGVILGTFAGLGTYTGAQGSWPTCSTPQISEGFNARLCHPASDGPYLLVGIAVCVVLCHAWMWWMLRVD